MKNILVIDDDVSIGNMLEEILTKEGYQVLRSYSGTEELLARIAVQLRNSASMGIAPVLEFDNISLHTGTHEVYVCGCPVKLTKTEYTILKLLISNPLQVITKTLLLEKISQDTPDCMESSLRVHISNLRKNYAMQKEGIILKPSGASDLR